MSIHWVGVKRLKLVSKLLKGNVCVKHLYSKKFEAAAVGKKNRKFGHAIQILDHHY